MSELLKIVSSQYKHLPGRMEDFIDPRTISAGSMMKNEPFSFQALYRVKEGFCQAVSVTAETDLPIAAWRVDYAALTSAANPLGEPCFESSAPGLFPDILMPRPANPELEQLNVLYNSSIFEKDTDNLLNATSTDFQSVWFTINPDSEMLAAGEYTIRILLKNLKDLSILGEETITVRVIDAELPAHDAYYTNWFYEDCIVDLFNVELYSDRFYEIFDQYIKNMTRHRQNVLLLPAFTPPLDTPIGTERMNVQLMDIEKTEDGWKFGFEKMRRFVRHADKCGIRIFEHCHLFSQWGATNTPNIYNTAGERIFGFDTDATGEEYKGFIRQYLTEFMQFAREEGIEDRLLFHISDEPSIDHLESYRKAHDIIADLIKGHPIADAMSRVEYYTEGLCDHPIANIAHADAFDGKCPTFWVYYTGGTYEKCCSNRLISNTAAQTRVLGVEMYRYKALGFLQWAYNFYYDRLSAGCCDPKCAPNFYKMYPGVTYLCYPVLARGGCYVVPSIREKLMAEAFDDLRALKLLESKIGREATLALCESHLGEVNSRLMLQGEALRELREAVNAKIGSMRKETVTRADLFAVLDLLEGASIPCFLDGGWGVDVLTGRETRPHRDIDINYDARFTDTLLSLLSENGYAAETDWMPVRMELYSDAWGYLDIHPIEFRPNGSARQADRGGGWYE
ncbi:MAG: DUF4091 domain-containing protein, partial [Clostridia bacterium]|nr:DUF4091 domain-containing protein [Clostridia bacterium]